MPDTAVFATLRGNKTTSLQGSAIYVRPALVLTELGTERPVQSYLFPSPQRTTRPGLPQQTARPRTP